MLPIAFLLKRTPKALLDRMPFTKFIDEDKEMDEGFVDKINQYRKVQVNINADMLKGKKAKQPTPNEGDYDEMRDNDYQSMNKV